MYRKDAQGNRLPVELKELSAPKVEAFEMKEGEKSEGSNKTLLYLVLVLGLVAAGVSGYLLYVHLKKEKKEPFGYHLDF